MQEYRSGGCKVAPFVKLQPLSLSPIISCFNVGFLGDSAVKLVLILLGMEVIPYGVGTNIHAPSCGHFQLCRSGDEEREDCDADIELD